MLVTACDHLGMDIYLWKLQRERWRLEKPVSNVERPKESPVWLLALGVRVQSSVSRAQLSVIGSREALTVEASLGDNVNLDSGVSTAVVDRACVDLGDGHGDWNGRRR